MLNVIVQLKGLYSRVLRWLNRRTGDERSVATEVAQGVDADPLNVLHSAINGVCQTGICYLLINW